MIMPLHIWAQRRSCWVILQTINHDQMFLKGSLCACADKDEDNDLVLSMKELSRQ
jgi:hypothetical protein